VETVIALIGIGGFGQPEPKPIPDSIAMKLAIAPE
jgi:hypothetical protein